MTFGKTFFKPIIFLFFTQQEIFFSSDSLCDPRIHDAKETTCLEKSIQLFVNYYTFVFLP